MNVASTLNRRLLTHDDQTLRIHSSTGRPLLLRRFRRSGDLAHRLLVPALYNLAMRGLLPEAFAIIGVARAERSEEAFRAELQNGLRHFVIGKVDDQIVSRLLSCVGYVAGDADDPATYRKLDQALTRIERDRDTGG